MPIIEIAKDKDKYLLEKLLLENDMGYMDPVDFFTLAKDGEEIIGCVRTEQHDGVMVIRPLLVNGAHRGKGIGRILLEEVLPEDKPTVVAARGSAVEFYEAMGFSSVSWERIPSCQKEECESCPDRTGCNPCPMIKYPKAEGNEENEKK